MAQPGGWEIRKSRTGYPLRLLCDSRFLTAKIAKDAKKTCMGSIVSRFTGVYLGVIAAARVYAQFAARLLGGDVDRAVFSVVFEQGRFVRNQVAAANHLLQLLKAMVQASDRAGHEISAAGAFREDLQGTLSDGGALTGDGKIAALVRFARAHGVDKNFSALGSRNRVLESGTAGVVFPVADHNQHPGHRLGFLAG